MPGDLGFIKVSPEHVDAVDSRHTPARRNSHLNSGRPSVGEAPPPGGGGSGDHRVVTGPQGGRADP